MPATARLKIGVSVCRIATCLSRAWPAPTQEIEPVAWASCVRPTYMNRVCPTDMNYMTYRDEKREINRIESGLGRKVKAAVRIS